MKKFYLIFGVFLLLAGCSEKEDVDSSIESLMTTGVESLLPVNADIQRPELIVSDVEKRVKLFASNYISPGRPASDIDVVVNIKPESVCVVGNCAVAWVGIANAKIPAVVQVINDQWFIDGISIDSEGQSAQPIPKAIIRNVVEKDDIQLGSISLPMEDYKMDIDVDGSRTVLFCDPGIGYCNDIIRTISEVGGVHLFFIPVGITEWANEASALILSSPFKLRNEVFLFLSNSKDVSADMLRGHLLDVKGIKITESLYLRSKDVVKKGVSGAKGYGIVKAPVVITSAGDVLMGSVERSVLIGYLKKQPAISSHVKSDKVNKDALIEKQNITRKSLNSVDLKQHSAADVVKEVHHQHGLLEQVEATE